MVEALDGSSSRGQPYLTMLSIPGDSSALSATPCQRRLGSSLVGWASTRSRPRGFDTGLDPPLEGAKCLDLGWDVRG